MEGGCCWGGFGCWVGGDWVGWGRVSAVGASDVIGGVLGVGAVRWVGEDWKMLQCSIGNVFFLKI